MVRFFFFYHDADLIVTFFGTIMKYAETEPVQLPPPYVLFDKKIYTYSTQSKHIFTDKTHFYDNQAYRRSALL